MTAAISGTSVRSLSKNRLRQLLSVDDKEVSETTFRRLCVQWKLAEALSMDAEEFKRRKNFWGKEAEALFKHLGIDENE
jgi:hypothetical protein